MIPHYIYTVLKCTIESLDIVLYGISLNENLLYVIFWMTDVLFNNIKKTCQLLENITAMVAGGQRALIRSQIMKLSTVFFNLVYLS